MQIMGRLDPQRKNYIHRNDNLGLLTQQNQRKNRQIFDRSKISVLAPIPFYGKIARTFMEIKSLMAD